MRIKRTWNPKQKLFVVEIGSGHYYVAKQDEIITTLIGSCICACIRDKVLKIGGCNHFLLPIGRKDDTEKMRTRAALYGDWAMEILINELLKRGGRRENLEVKVFGGAKLSDAMTDIGKMNIDFVMQYIKDESLKLLNYDVGDIYARRVIYYPTTGIARVKKLIISPDKIVTEEQIYLRRLKKRPMGKIELF